MKTTSHVAADKQIDAASMPTYSIPPPSGKKATPLEPRKHGATRHGEPIHHSPPSANECYYCAQESAEISAPKESFSLEWEEDVAGDGEEKT